MMLHPASDRRVCVAATAMVAGLALAESPETRTAEIHESWIAVVPGDRAYWGASQTFWWIPEDHAAPRNATPSDRQVEVPVLQVRPAEQGYAIERYRFRCDESLMRRIERLVFNDHGDPFSRSDEAENFSALPHSAENEVFDRVCGPISPHRASPPRARSISEAIAKSRARTP